MWKWIISPTGRTIAVYAAIVIASLLIARWYGNKQWAKGEAEGRRYAADKLTKEKEKEWAERERKLMDAAAKLREQAGAINTATAELAAARAGLQKSLDTDLERIRNEREKDYISAASVPDDRVWHDIRAASGYLSGNP